MSNLVKEYVTTENSQFLIFECPHCNEIEQFPSEINESTDSFNEIEQFPSEIIVKKSDINCRIFRHGIYKSNFKQMNPHAPKEVCDRLFAEKMIYGCGKPFMLYPKENSYEVKKCEYI